MSDIIEVRDLRKSYGSVKAMDGISFSVKKGSLFAFLGPNGAGKSTTIDTICTFLAPDSGFVSVDGLILGKDDKKIRRSIGAVWQDGLLDPRLTVEENLKTRGGFYGLSGKELTSAALRASEIAGTTEFYKRRYGKLSGGQRRRADIARALINMPKILFLDEPTTGLDPQTRLNVWQTISQLSKETDMTVFLTTHYMEEAEAADDVVVIDNGRIAAHDTPAQLRRKYAHDRLSLTASDDDKLIYTLMSKNAVFTRSGGRYLVSIDSTVDALPLLDEVRPYISAFEVSEGTMDDAFIAITGKEIRE